MLASGLVATAGLPAQAAPDTTITPQPAHAGAPFQGWGNSLVWFANATGDYPEELRTELYDLVFGAEGLNMNVARYNIGGGRASDVGNYFRQGAAVDGFWAADTSTEESSLYGDVTTNYADHLNLAQAWDPNNPDHYDWTQDATQRWWLEKLAKERDDLVLEGFANSPPWFLTVSGYSSGGANSSTEQVLTSHDAPAKFATYLTKVVEHLEDEYDVSFQTVTPFNEPCTGYWSTPSGRLADGITPFTNATKKPQEGAQICPGTGAGQQQSLINLLNAELQKSTSDAVVSANDETNPQNFNNAWAKYDQATRDKVGQLNVHTYWDGGSLQSRDYALAAGKPLWMSETGGDFVGGAFDPVAISGGLGLAQKITDDLRKLQPDAYVLWQEVEDYYNMEQPTPRGENLNWGSVFIDFDCEWIGADGSVLPSEQDAVGFKSLRRVNDALANSKQASTVEDCHIVTNSKFDTMRNFMHFITAGDRIIEAGHANATAAVDADGSGASIIYTNSSNSDRTVEIDLANFAEITSSASVTPYVTTQAADVNDTSTALVKGDTVQISKKSGTATLTVPARSVTTFDVDGVSGVADEANPLIDGATYQVQGVQSSKMLTQSGDGKLTITSPSTSSDSVKNQLWTMHETTSNAAPSNRRSFVLENEANGRFLSATSAGTSFTGGTLEEASASPNTTWYLTTLDGSTWSMVNGATASSLDVAGQSSADGTSVGIYGSNGGANQRWTFREISATPTVKDVTVRTAVGVTPTLPTTVTPTYTWGEGVATPITWNTPDGVWDRPGTVTVLGSGVDVYGNVITGVRAIVEVGAVTIADPVSVTVTAGTPRALLAAQAPTTAPVQVGLGESRFPLPVTWDFTGITDEQLAEPGHYPVTGTISAADTGSKEITAKLAVIVAPADGSINIATQSTASASFTEPGYSVAGTINGNLADKAWSNWRSGTKNATDTLTYTFPSAQLVSGAGQVFYRDGSSLSWPVSVTVQVRTPGTQTWVSVGSAANINDPEFGVDFDTVYTDAVRFVMTARDNTHMVVSESLIESPQPAASAYTELARLSVGGVDVEGFTPDTLEYTAVARGSAPAVVGVPLDSAASVTTEVDGDVATVTVTAPTGDTRSYTVTLDRVVGVPLVSITGSAVAGSAVEAAVVTDPADAEVTYQWFLGDEEIEGATGSSFTPSLADAGAALSVQVTATAPGFGSTTSRSDAVAVVDGRVAPTVTVSASPKTITVGASTTLTASVTTKDQGTVTGGVVEFRSGALTLGTATVNAQGVASVKVNDLREGSYPVVAVFTPPAASQYVLAAGSSAPVVVSVEKKALATSTTKVTLTPKAPTTKDRVVANVSVTAKNADVTGKVTVTVKDARGKKVHSTSATLKRGKAAVKLPQFKGIGKHTVTAAYAGTSTVKPSTGSTSVTVKATTTTKAKVTTKKVTPRDKAKVAITVKASPKATVSGKATVRVYQGKKQVASQKVTVRGSKATATLKALPRGSYTVKVTFDGSATAAGSEAKTVKLSVK